MASMIVKTKELTPEERQTLILAGVGPVQEKLGWPHFTKLTGASLRKLVDAGAVLIEAKTGGFYLRLAGDAFRTGHDEQGLAFLEQYQKKIGEPTYAEAETATSFWELMDKFPGFRKRQIRWSKDHSMHFSDPADQAICEKYLTEAPAAAA